MREGLLILHLWPFYIYGPRTIWYIQHDACTMEEEEELEYKDLVVVFTSTVELHI